MIDLKPAASRMIDLLAGMTDDQLGDPTPCSEFTVQDLLEHLDVVALGFTAVARKECSPFPTAVDARGRDELAERIRTLGSSWDGPDAWRGTSAGPGVDLPNETWGAIAFTELVVHGWDLARATGQPFDLPEEAVRACLDHVAEFVPNAPVEGLWQPAVEVSADAPALDRVVAITGRDPAAFASTRLPT